MSRDEHDSVISTHGITYVEEMSSPSGRPAPATRPELLLLGAFPRGEGSTQEVREAVHEITTTWLTRGGRLRFGGHPTITPLVNVAAAAVVGEHQPEYVTIYQSRFFPIARDLREIAEWATVEDTESTGEQDTSLTIMRERMVGDGALAAAVVIGGRTTEQGQHTPGVDEEVRLVRERGVAVYLLGRPGGRAATLIEQCRDEQPPWSSLGNALSADENEDLSDTDDYWRVARTLWDRHAT
jgi:hypothetical protein